MSFLVTRIETVDHEISDFFAASKVPWLKKLLEFLTHLGDGWIWILAYLVSFLFFREYLSSIIFPVVTAEVTGLLMIVPLRYAVRRERPDKTYKTHFLTPWNRYSFPSHHAMRSFIIALVLGIQYPSLLVPLLVMAGTISFSRVVLARHYLSDVLAGASMGCFLAIVSVNLLS